jgi:hypothetical protein
MRNRVRNDSLDKGTLPLLLPSSKPLAKHSIMRSARAACCSTCPGSRCPYATFDKTEGMGDLATPLLTTMALVKSVSYGILPIRRPHQSSDLVGDGRREPTVPRYPTTKDRWSKSQFLTQWQEIILVATRTMQQHERRFGRISASDEVVGVSWLNHNEYGQRQIDLHSYM